MSGLSATSFRIGQITSGAPQGAWLGPHHRPRGKSITCLLISLLADVAQKVASWLSPRAIPDVAFADPLAVNLVHPRPIAWFTSNIMTKDIYSADQLNNILA